MPDTVIPLYIKWKGGQVFKPASQFEKLLEISIVLFLDQKFQNLSTSGPAEGQEIWGARSNARLLHETGFTPNSSKIWELGAASQVEI